MAGQTEILWRSEALASAERCVIADAPGLSSIAGIAVLALDAAPASITYAIDTDDSWFAHAARIDITAGTATQTILIERKANRWFVAGTARPDLDACTTIDLGWSPATNTLALRAQPLAPGQARSGHAAWLRFPELDVVASEQAYTRLALDRVRYTSSTFTAELQMADRDVVRTYGDALWHADTLRHVN